jgi:uncharacterized protein
MSLKVDSGFRLVVVQGYDEAGQVDESLEPLLAEEGSIRLLDLVEDELLLALPAVALHDQCEAPAFDDGEISVDEPRENPFAALERLKKTD